MYRTKAILYLLERLGFGMVAGMGTVLLKLVPGIKFEIYL